MKKKIPTYPEITEDLESQNSESQIPNSPIRGIPKNELKYSIDDLIDVWVRGCTNGATLWQYLIDKQSDAEHSSSSQQNNKQLPSSFEYGLQLLQEELNKVEDKHIGLHEITSSNMLLLGLFSELLDRK